MVDAGLFRGACRTAQAGWNQSKLLKHHDLGGFDFGISWDCLGRCQLAVVGYRYVGPDFGLCILI
jgi:hypothetical protein